MKKILYRDSNYEWAVIQFMGRVYHEVKRYKRKQDAVRFRDKLAKEDPGNAKYLWLCLLKLPLASKL